MAGRMKNTGSDIGHVCDNSGKLQCIHKCNGSFPSTLYAEGKNTAGTLGKVFLSQFIFRIRRKTRIAYPSDFGMIQKMLCNSQRITAVTLHTKMQRLKSKAEIERVLRSRHGSEITHELYLSLIHISEP